MGSSLLCDTKVSASVSELPFSSLLVVLGTTGGNDKRCVGSYLCARVHGNTGLRVCGCESVSEPSPETSSPQRRLDVR